MRDSNIKFAVITYVVALALTATISYAAPYIDTFDASDAGWSMTDRNGNLPSDLTTLGGTYEWNSGGYLSLAIDTDNTRPYQDLLFDNSGNHLPGGDYISFDFYAKDTGGATKLYTYIRGNGIGWVNEITSLTLDAWTGYNVGLGFNAGSGWGRLDGASRTYSDWSTSFAAMDEIGIMIWYQDNTAGQVYGLDNFTIVPEPETWLMLGFALVSLGFTFRKEVNETLAKARATIA